MTDTAKSLLVKDAFMKANKTAFHNVIHYLVMIINANEFRKRFRWPVFSSRDETDFRNAALAYFNECQKNYKWIFGPFKMQVVLFPGGLEFMKIVNELSKMAMRTVLRENDSLHLINSDGFSLHRANLKITAAERAYAEMEQMFRQVRELSIPIKEKTVHLLEVFRHAVSNTSIRETVFDEGFLNAWDSNHSKTIDEKILPIIQQLENFKYKCSIFEQNITAAQPKQIHFDKDKMNALGLLKNTEHFNAQLDYDKLIQWLICNMPILIDTMHFKAPWPLDQLEIESHLLEQHVRRANSLLLRIDAFAMDTSLEFNTMNDKMTSATYYWREKLAEKLVLTPTIKLPAKKDFRIAIWDAIYVDSTTNGLGFSPTRKLQPLIEDTSGFSEEFESIDVTAMRTVSTKLDPMSMLNSAMNRNKGFGKSKASPKRTAYRSPSRLNNNNMPAFNSTMLSKDEQWKSPVANVTPNQINFSPLAKRLFS
ncbi:augmin complex subunit dgt6-like isoform X2 [Contarinia nasturtii]|nr:augmin complex subunit dgt6-like isoform X2 [Contarinia nasturtii]